MNMTPQEMAAAAAAMVRQSGAPLSAENMNRAMSAVMAGQTTMEGENAPIMERAIARSMQPRNAAPRTGAARGGEGSIEATTQDNMQTDPIYEEVMNAGTEAPISQRFDTSTTQPPQTRGARVAAGEPTARRAGTINAATRIDEDNPEAGMYGGTQPRQADETGVDQTGLALSMLSPMLNAGGAAVIAQSPVARALMARLLGGPADAGYVASQGVNAGRNMTMAQNIATSDRNLRAMQEANRLRRQGVNARPNMQRIQRLPNEEGLMR